MKKLLIALVCAIIIASVSLAFSLHRIRKNIVQLNDSYESVLSEAESQRQKIAEYEQKLSEIDEPETCPWSIFEPVPANSTSTEGNGRKTLNISYIDTVPTMFHRAFTDENGNQFGESWGFTPEDMFCDIDDDGENELVCNCVFGDGANEVFVYKVIDGVLMRGMMPGDREFPDRGSYESRTSASYFDYKGAQFVYTYKNNSGSRTVLRYNYDDLSAFEWEEYIPD